MTSATDSRPAPDSGTRPASRQADDTPAAPGLRERKKLALRHNIVAIAGRRFSNDGYADTNMRDIADEAGVAYQTLYNHYPNKARLAIAWLARLTDSTNVAASLFWAEAPSHPRDAVLASVDLYVDLVASVDRRLWREATAEYMQAPEDFAELAEVMSLSARTRILDMLAACKQTGALHPDTDEGTLADVIYALVDHALLHFTTVPTLTRQDILDALHAQLELVLGPWLIQT